MKTNKILGVAIVFISIVTVTATDECPGVSMYSKPSNGKHRLTTILRGNYTIQALITFSTGSDCSKVSKEGVIRSLAIKYAVDKMNEDVNFKKFAQLGIQLDDVCRSLPVTMARGIEVVSLHRPNSVCRADFLKCEKGKEVTQADVKQATAVIGTTMSFTTIPLASLMSLFYIPQISPSASSRLLSKKDLYKSFFRTIPSDKNQVKAMLDIFVKFNWNYIFAIGSDDDYGKLGVSELKTEASGKNVCISRDEYIPYQSSRTKTKIIEVVKKIASEKQAKVVVLFCYIRNLGDIILKEAQKQGVERIWLTSEAWNPSAETVLSKVLKNQTVGILTVALKVYPMQYLITYMEKEVKREYRCSMWLKLYLKEKFKCEPKNISVDTKTLLGTNCSISIADVMKDLSVLPGKISNLIDATTTLAHGIHHIVKTHCEKVGSMCKLTSIKTQNLTNAIFDISFKNEQNEEVSFDDKGDPKYAFYTIENLQWVNNSYKYISVGNWSQRRAGHELQLEDANIIWPDWVRSNPSNSDANGYPKSRCNDACKPGQFVAARTGCCWGCQNCRDKAYTDKMMADKCIPCPEGHHANDEHTQCIKTPLRWLEISNPAGTAIIIISGVGLLLMAVASFLLFKFRHIIILEDSAPHLIALSCVLLLLTFIYGPLHIAKPDKHLCQGRNSFFFLLLMMYAAILLIKSKFMTKFLQRHAEKSFRNRLFTAQALFLFMLFLLELVSVVAWLYIDKVPFIKTPTNDKKEDWLQCQVDFTAARLVSTFIPCIVLIIATFCAFRERNMEHSFYEPKFLSFTCIALCIIIVAFLPTFKYVLGIYKSIVMAFTIDVFGYTYMACLILPKVYVALVRHRRGDTENVVKAKQVKKEEMVRHHSLPPLEATESSMIETSVVKENHSMSNVSFPNGDHADSLDGKQEQVEKENGFTNVIYEQAQEFGDTVKTGHVYENTHSNHTKF